MKQPGIKSAIAYFLLIISSCILLQACGGEQVREDDAGFIDLYLEQDGRIINFIDDTAAIKRAPFRIVFNFKRPDGLLVNASYEPDSLSSARAGAELRMIPGFTSTGIAEEPFNRDYSMFVSSDSPNYWYYYDDSDTRFDFVLKEDGLLKCRRSVSSIIDLDKNGEKKDISKISHESIYLVIIRIEWNEDYTKMIDKTRRCLEIKFIP